MSLIFSSTVILQAFTKQSSFCVCVAMCFKPHIPEHKRLTMATLSIWWFQVTGNRRQGEEQGAGFTLRVSAQTSNFLLPESLPPEAGWEEPEATLLKPLRLGWG